jgi:predicted dehydrogenase
MKNKSKLISRRSFIKNMVSASSITAGTSLTFPFIVPRSVFGKEAPSNQLNMGCIGVGRMGRTDLQGFLEFDQIRVVAVCDIDSNRASDARILVEKKYASHIKNNKYAGCVVLHDYKELLAKSDIDVVSIVTPDHWHALCAIDAAKAGKDTYLEKPMTRTIDEGKKLCTAIKRYGVILQLGSQQRSDAKFRYACELVRNGRIGDLRTVKVGLPVDPATTPQQTMPVPPSLDYNIWLGVAPWKPYTENRVHPQDGYGRPGWMRVTDYTAGMITNWGAHHIDISLWGMGEQAGGPVEIMAKADFPKDGLWNVHGKFRVEYKFASGVNLICASQNGLGQGILFEGDKGWIFVRRGFLDAHPKTVLSSKIRQNELILYKSEDHKANFIDCVKSRRLPAAPVEVGHLANTFCLLGEIAMNLNRKLNWDIEKERFIGDLEANRLLATPMRDPWVM